MPSEREVARDTLQDLVAALDVIGADIEAAGGEFVPGSSLEAAWNEAAGALVAKVDGFAVYTLELEGRADALEDGAKRLKAKAQAVRAHRERLLEYAGRCIGPDRKELAGDVWKIARVKNPPRVTVLDEQAMFETCPKAIKRTKLDGRYEMAEDGLYELSIDLNALKAELRGSKSEHIRGAVIEQGERIEVKP